MLPVVTAVLGVVGEVVQVVATAGVAWPYPEGRADAENLQKKKLSVAQGSAGPC